MNEVTNILTTPRGLVDAFADAATRPLLDLSAGLLALPDMAGDREGSRVVRADGVAWIAARLRADANQVMQALDAGRRLAAERLAALDAMSGAG